MTMNSAVSTKSRFPRCPGDARRRVAPILPVAARIAMAAMRLGTGALLRLEFAPVIHWEDAVMIVRRQEELEGTDKATTVAHGTVAVVRYLLRDDGAGFSVSDVTVPAGTDNVLQYRHHVEANLVLEGEGTVEDLATGKKHRLTPGTIYVVFPEDRHRVRAEKSMRVISIFNPPLVGTENHDADGGYPPPR
jgi:L-ectoine synthase